MAHKDSTKGKPGFLTSYILQEVVRGLSFDPHTSFGSCFAGFLQGSEGNLRANHAVSRLGTVEFHGVPSADQLEKRPARNVD